MAAEEPYRVIVDCNIIEEYEWHKCEKCGNSNLSQEWINRGQGPSPYLKTKCLDCNHNWTFKTCEDWKGKVESRMVNRTAFLLCIAILITEATYSQVIAYILI